MKCLFFWLLLFGGFSIQASQSPILYSATALAKGQCQLFSNDAFSPLSNPALMSRQSFSSLALSSVRLFSDAELNQAIVSVLWHGRGNFFSHQSLGFGLHYMGYEPYYSEGQLMVSYGRALNDRFSIGMQLPVLIRHSSIEPLRIRPEAALSFVYRPKPDWQVGCSLQHLIPWRWSRLSEDRIETALIIGCCYDVSDKLRFETELEKSLNAALQFRAGLDYAWKSSLHAYAGFHTAATAVSAGLSFRKNRWRIDAAAAYQFHLGYSPALSLQWNFKESKRALSVQKELGHEN